MAKKKTNPKKLRPVQRKAIRIFGIFFFTLLFLHLGLYFGSDLLLRNYLQREVEKISGGKYAIDFDRFNLSLLERGFYVQGFTLTPVDASIDVIHNRPFYKVTIPEISVKNLGYDFSGERLTIGDLKFRKPAVQSKQDQLQKEQRISPLEVLEAEIRKSFGEGLQQIVIRNLYIEEADLLLENFISQKSITAENTNLYLKNIQFFAQKENTSPFNAEGFDLDLQNFEMVLADSIHTVKATSINVSSLDRFIKAQKVSIVPDFRRESSIYYEIGLDNLELMGSDINQIFYTSDVNISQLKLDHPKFNLYSDVTARTKAGVAKGLYPLIENILASISIADLSIVNGEYLQRGVNDPGKNRIEAAGINFQMDQVYIGPDESKTENQFFYAENAALDIARARVALADGVHWVSGENVFLSSFEDRIAIDNIKVIPVFKEGQVPEITLFEIEVPHVSLGKANLKKIYNENILDIDEMMISSPSVLLKDLVPKQELTGKSTLRELTQDYLKAIYIKRLEMTGGTLVLDNDLRVRQDSLSFGEINFVLEDFQLDKQIDSEESPRIFLAEDLRLEIEDYALKLSDNLHLFTAKKILLDTKEQFIGIEGFRLRPQSPDNIQNTLDKYSKTTILDIEVPDFYAHGVDISEAIFNEKLFVQEIEVPSPIIKIQIHSNEEEGNDEGKKVDRRDILNLLTNYFSVVKVGAVNVAEGTLVFENLGRDKMQTFSENDVTIGIKDFYVDKFIDPMDARVLFADELDIRLNNYVFNIAEGKYRIVADGISYNSAREEISTSNVRLRPSRTLDAAAVIQADIPNMTVKGVDLEAFLFENTLSLTKLKLSGADVKLFLNRDKQENDTVSRNPRRRERNLPKTIDIIKIDTVEAEDAKFNLAYRKGDQDLELINSGVNMSFYGFLLDSAKLTEGDIAAFFSNMSMDIDEFSLSLKDSIHTINFSRVGLDSKSEEIVFDNFTITPRNLTGKKGIPVIEAKIPRVSVKTNSLTSLQRTGDMVIKQLLLSEPEIILYLDQENAEVSAVDEEKIAQKVIETLNIENFEIEEGLLTLRQKGKGEEINSFKNLSIVLSDLDFDLSADSTMSRNFYLNNDFEFELTDYEIKLPDSLNSLKIGLALLSKDHLQLKDVSLVPRYGDYEYGRKVGVQTDVAKVHISEVVFHGLNIEKLMGEKILDAGKVTLSNITADIFRDKRYKMQADLSKGMPQQLMMNGLFEIRLDSLMVQNADIIYREFPENGLIPGELRFMDLKAVISPFYVSKNPEGYPVSTSFLKSSALLNGQAPLSLNGALFFQAPYPIHLVAEVGEFELSLLNTILETNAFSSVLDGVVRGGKWEFTLDDEVARGNMSICYNDLKLRLLEERTLERGRGRKNVLTFVLNNLAVRSNNPRSLFNNFVKASIYQKRDKSRFIFNYLWKSTLSGLKGSVGLGQAKAPKKEREEEGEKKE